MKEWLRETHGPGFELLRHFLRRFFDSDIVTAPGQTQATLVWAFAIVGPWFLMLTGSLFRKYAELLCYGSRRSRTAWPSRLTNSGWSRS